MTTLTAWVQPAVVLWTTLQPRSIKNARVAWIDGRALTDVSTAGPGRHFR
jgi:hypothetical protein